MNPSFLDALLLAPDQGAAEAVAATHLAEALASRNGGDASALLRAEGSAARDAESAFHLDPTGVATLRTTGQDGSESWCAGRFETPTVGSLERQLQASQPRAGGSLKLSVLDGVSPLTDIGWLQASAPEGTLFQVASQFNCLESPGSYVVPVRDYLHDATQGPRAAIGAFPAALLRHYFAPGPNGGRFTQVTDGAQVDLLASACGPGMAPNGYLTGQQVDDPMVFVDRLEANASEIRVGVHDEVDVVLGYDWTGSVRPGAPRIAQVMTSTVAGGEYGARARFGDDVFERAAGQLLRSAYHGTLLAAACRGKKWVVLTLIGGGVFGNPTRLIWDSIVWALEQVEPLMGHDMHVVVNGRDLSRKVDFDAVVMPEVRRRGGCVCALDGGGLRTRTQ